MATLNKLTVSKDARGNVTTEKVWQDFSDITPSNGVRAWSITQNDGVYTLTETFIDEINVPDPDGGPPTKAYPDTWSCEVSTAADPIESHPKFASISDANWEKYRKWRNGAPEPSDWTPSQMGGNGAVLQAYINKEITTYLAPKIVIKHTFVSTAKPNLGKIGKLDYPSFAENMAPAGVNFILTGASCVQDGSVYKMSYEWLGSALGGWSTFLYGTE
jgi:hypothetical protein